MICLKWSGGGGRGSGVQNSHLLEAHCDMFEDYFICRKLPRVLYSTFDDKFTQLQPIAHTQKLLCYSSLTPPPPSSLEKAAK